MFCRILEPLAMGFGRVCSVASQFQSWLAAHFASTTNEEAKKRLIADIPSELANILPSASFVDAVPWAAKISEGVVPAAGQYFAMQTFHWNVRNSVINDATNDAL